VQLFRQRGGAGLKLGHVGKVNIQTYVLRQCMLEGTRMRTYDYDVLLHEEDKEIQHSQHDDYGEDARVHLRHRSGPLQAQE
jgi:hypothetical protein